MQMDGKEVFRRAVRIMVDSARSRWTTPASPPTTSPSSCRTRPTSGSSARPCDRLGIAMDRTALVLDRTGNTSSASCRWRWPTPSTPAGQRRRLVLFVGFGAGMTAASAIIRWSRRRRARPTGATLRPPEPRAGRIVLVTGGSRGIGPGDAQRFARLGDRVAVTYNVRAPPDGPVRVKCDVTSSDDVDAAFGASRRVRRHRRGARVERRHHQRRALLLRMSEDDFTSVIDANLTAAYRVSKRAAQGMLRRARAASS
jgi:hypothetical protein